MKPYNKTVVLKIRGMTCNNCEHRIQKKLNDTEGIFEAKVSFAKSSVEITFDPSIITLDEVESIVKTLGYELVENGKEEKGNSNISTVLGILAILYAIYMIARRFGVLDLFQIFPKVNESMSYGVLFLIGLLTSFHCVAMCGGINLSQCVNRTKNNGIEGKAALLMPGFLYNAGRVISYTIIGGLIGAVGSVFTLSSSTQGIIQIVAGIFMVIMGLNLLNIFPWLRKFNLSMPRFLADKINTEKRNRAPFFVGLLNGLMPCGPLQAMQLYALSTQDPIKGALSMLLFSLGTVPLMFLLSAASSFLTKKFANKMIAVGAVLVVVLGISMLNRGLSLTGYAASPTSGNSSQKTSTAVVSDALQTVTTTLDSGTYEPITVKAGTPVKWTIHADQGSLTGCNSTIVIPAYGIKKELHPGDNIIEFTPTETGTFSYSCWMGMIRSSITVTNGTGEDSSNKDAKAAKEEGSQNQPAILGNTGTGGSCCGANVGK